MMMKWFILHVLTTGQLAIDATSTSSPARIALCDSEYTECEVPPVKYNVKYLQGGNEAYVFVTTNLRTCQCEVFGKVTFKGDLSVNGKSCRRVDKKHFNLKEVQKRSDSDVGRRFLYVARCPAVPRIEEVSGFNFNWNVTSEE